MSLRLPEGRAWGGRWVFQGTCPTWGVFKGRGDSPVAGPRGQGHTGISKLQGPTTWMIISRKGTPRVKQPSLRPEGQTDVSPWTLATPSFA